MLMLFSLVLEYSMMTNFDQLSMTDDEEHDRSGTLFVSVDDLPPLPELPSLSELVEDFDVEYFSSLA